MKTNTAIYLYAPHAFFNPISVKNFFSLDQSDSVILYTTLLENLLEIVTKLKISTDKYLLLHSEDENLYKGFDPGLITVKYLASDSSSLGTYLAKKSVSYSDNIFILADSIGISQSGINHCINLLNIDDDAIVIGKCFNGFISFLAYNKIDIETVNHLIDSEFNYMKFLAKLDSCPAFLNVMEKFQRILSTEDFNKLYKELSKKESLSYCSQEMHERFTHLFIEHKELLQ